MNIATFPGAGSVTAGSLDREQLLRPAFWVGFAALCAGAVAFGAVYPWGYFPLAALCAASGLAGLVTLPGVRRGFVSRPLAIALGMLGGAMAVQLVPLPVATLSALSGRTLSVLRQLDPMVAMGLIGWHPLSIAPGSTRVALALYASFAVFLLGFTRLLSLMGARRFVDALTLAGVVLALIGIIQKPLDNGKIYGFWTPLMDGALSFGPFVNKNHFAGWMLLVLPLALARLSAGIDRSTVGIKPGWRDRLLWCASPEASRLVMLAGGIVVMALALVLTMSRSGMASFVLALVITGAFVARSQTSRSRKMAGVGYLVVVATIIVGSVGVDAIATRFSKTDWSEFNNRRGAWIDGWSIAVDFPIAGTGLNTYGTANLLYQRHNLDRSYTESHDDYLQLLAEGGGLIAIPALACVVLFIRDVRRRFREARGSTAWWLRAGAVTALVAIALQETVEFSLQVPANAVLFAAVCAVALHQAPARTSSPSGDSRDAARSVPVRP